MEIEVPAELKNNKNKSVLEFLRPLSCHGDIIETTYRLLETEKEVKFFCPDGKNFKYCFWYVETSIFAFGSGMHFIGLLLPPKFCVEAISSGAIESKNIGIGWVQFPYNHAELTKWVTLALASAKGL